MTFYTRDFWLATVERIVRTAAGTLLALLTADGFDLLSADWTGIGAAVGLACLVSLLLAVIGNAASRNGPSFTSSEQVVPPEPQPVDGELPPH